MRDARGEKNAIIGRANVERVRRIIKNSPQLSKGEVCKELGISRTTLRKHLIAIEQG